VLAVPPGSAIEEVSTFIIFADKFSMSRVQHLVLIVLSSVVFFFLVVQAASSLWLQQLQKNLFRAQEIVQQGRVCDQRWRQLIGRIAEVGQKTQDQALKDLLTRQGITVRVNPAPTSDSSSSMPGTAPSPTGT
jgi:hypothetical protein